MVGTKNSIMNKWEEKMKYYKMTWRFLKKHLLVVIMMVLSLIIFQFLSAISPLVVQNILDKQVMAIVDNWSETDQSSDAVFYQGKYYTVAENKMSADATIILLTDGFYFTDNNVDLSLSITENLSENQIVVNNETYQVKKLSDVEIKSFYQKQMPTIIRVITILIVVQLFSVLFSYLQRFSGAFMFSNIARDVRIEAAQKLPYINIQMLESDPAGKTANRFLSDSVGVPQLYMSTINIFISSILSIVFSFIGMYILEPKLAIACIIIIPIMYFWIRNFTKKINDVATKVNETNSLIVSRINEIINGIEILKAFNTKDDVIKDFTDLNNQFLEEQMTEVNLHVKKGWNGIQLFQGVTSAIVILVLAYLNLKGIISIEAGIIYAYYMYIGKIIAPIGLLFHEFGMLEHSKVKINRIFRILDAELDDAKLVEIPKYHGDISFKNVNFKYDNESSKHALKNFNLEIKSGEKVGIVGRSGSGKSTLINLLLRYNDLEKSGSGMIYVDQEPINKYSKRTYRQHIGIILQEPIIFGGTIASNISFGKQVSNAQIIEVLEMVGGEKLLNKINYNVDYPIKNRGMNLSLGEKQIISFARVLIRNPQILIMDEATANIDIETEKMINYAIEVISKKRTMIIVAHRLSTIRDADQIVVLEQGEIKEKGNHLDLLNKKGKYAVMYTNQLTM